jgi:hypothetical protein
MLQDNDKRRRMELESMFGVDFGDGGDGGVGLI